MLADAAAWALLPIAVALFVLVAASLGALVLEGERRSVRALGGAVLALGLVAVGVRILGAVGGLGRTSLFAALLVACAALGALVARRRSRRSALDPACSGLARALERARGLVSSETLPMALVAAAVLLVSAAAAFLLPIWQWDAVGYHLPYVNFALQTGSLGGVPPDIYYISTYPHVVEHLYIAWRAMLPDDRLLDAAQIPLGLFGSLAIATLALELGARRDHAVAAGLAWLAFPATFLQLPTNYIDVASTSLLLAAAAFSLGTMSARNVVVAGVALGLFLGSKPTAPIGAALVFGVLAVRGWRAGHRRSLALAAACALGLGAESYLVNVVRHGNPIWPVAVDLGPLHLPGPKAMGYVLENGPEAPHLVGPFRVLRAWLTVTAPPAFDMRFGGLGVVFLASLPLAAVALVRRRSLALYVVVVASLASPDPAVPRYILGFPALALALTVPALRDLGARARRAVLWVAAASAALAVWYAFPGLTGEGPSLLSYVRMDPAERARAVGADGPPTEFLDAHARVLPTETVAFDDSLILPYLAWPPDLSHRALWLAPDAERAFVERVVADPAVAMLVVGDLTRAALLAQSEFQAIFHCKSSPCTVYLRRPARAARAAR